ncbi:DEAD/DEAH box helicase [Candidatus Woesearchaeota archaeon]|nr:DEAD/DEAH box helicase [Candidatus Woesearchaeota archaeon]
MSFSHLQLPPLVLKAVQEQGYSMPTAIQEKAIPLLLAGKDVIGHSQTGSGKTAAFGLPLVSLLTRGKGVQGLILTPTRELCIQVSEALAAFGKHMGLKILAVYGGVGLGAQLNGFRFADIIVATPGRLLDLIERGCKLTNVRYLVLDEADRMLDMGFIDDVEKIIRHTPKHRQTVLFSATLSSKLRAIVQRHMNNPIPIQTETRVDTSLLIETAYMVQQPEKFSLLVHFLKAHNSGISLIFCATRHQCDKIARQLRSQKLDAIPIHGGLSQSKRMHTISMLHKRGFGILVATDVASRGLHIENISHVYNYELPQAPDDYVHRIGRTARAGAKGDAIIFVTPQDLREFKSMARVLNRDIKSTPLPQFEKVIVPTAPMHERTSPDRKFQRHGQNRPGGRPGGKPFWKRGRR